MMGMKVSNKILLEEFVQKFAGAKTAVNKWLKVMEGNNIGTHIELKALFPSVDYVGIFRYVFNIKGNHYRFVVLIVFSNNIA
ncbi:MAG: type II toxin-antitoxin system HigB family toxin [Sphingobacteriales bacterium]|nr:type II toxin-antitoxin system HigB family toxin [Sphingobacteriales bacterium]